MDLTLDSDLSEQLSDCKEGEDIVLMGTVTKNEKGAVTVSVTSAESDDEEDENEQQGGEGEEENQGNGEYEGAPAIPGPVKTLLKRK